MITRSRFIAVSVFTLGLLMNATAAFAQADAVKLRQVAGGYLDAVEFATQLNESRCGRIARVETEDFGQALADMVGYVSDAEVEALRAYLASDEFHGVQREQRELIADWIASSAKYQDEDSFCRAAVTRVSDAYQNAKQQWLRAKASFRG
jgi:hypothetical protein